MTTSVQGIIYRADGSLAQGTLVVSWPAFSTATNQAVAAGSVASTIGTNGSVTLNLAPNQGAYPDGTYYTAVYHLNDGTVTKEYWVVPAATAASISSIRAQLAPATVAVQAVSKSYVDNSISGITGSYLSLGGGTMSGSLLLNGDPTSGSQAATKHYADTLAAAQLPLTGGALTGALNAPSLSVTSSAEIRGQLNAATLNGEITVDGATYSTLNSAWSAALGAATSSGKNSTVRLGPGTFAVTSTLTEPTNGACVNLIGSGGATVNAGSAAATTLSITTNLSGDLFYLGNAAQAQSCTFKDFVVLAATNATHGFEMQWFRGLLIDNVTVNDTTAEGILLGEETTSSGHQSNFLLRNVTVSYNASLFTPSSRPAYGIHMQKTAIDSHLDDIVVRNALTAAVYNEGTGITGYLIHGFGYPYTCTTGPCVNNASSGSAANASYATNYVIDDVGGSGSVWTDTYADSPAIAGFYIGANGIAIHGGHIQWPELTSFPGANLAYVASTVTNNMLIADVDCLGMNSAVNWITYGGASGNPPTFTSVHHLTGCGNYFQALEPAEVTGFSSGGANINDTSSAVPRVWSTPIASASSYPAFAAQMYTGYQGDIFQGHFSGLNPFFNVTYQGTIKSNGGIALSTILNTASTLTLTSANKNVIANAASGAQTLTLPSCFTAWPDKASPAGLEFTIIKSDTSANAVTLQTVSSQAINYAGATATTLTISAAGKRTLVCGTDYNWYAF
ncbi:hypothetical protein HNQ77_003686 [Silvibacterium bohemicum]|uniref:Uncharacterized protein n=1 Tax=Silvibacterium bohemicum TaxID=1577686 RepID=A0A841JYM1_9BACT|nr:hypothetical protein [Silvibacterium bohemicum]MBB6145725.1 hypothetical protein [Silvibacterium bohemicum]